MKPRTESGEGIAEVIGDKREQILQIARKQGVSNVRVFESVARGEATSESDVDFLVDGLENSVWGGGRLLIELQNLLGRRIDLVSVKDLHPLMRDEVLREAIPL